MSGRRSGGGGGADCEWPPPPQVAAVNERKSSIMIDLERDECVEQQHQADERLRTRAAPEWKFTKKRTRVRGFKFIEDRGKSKSKKQTCDTHFAFILTLVLATVHCYSGVQPTAASSNEQHNSPAAPTGHHQQFPQSPDHFPSATLGKFGLIAGLRFDARNSSVAAFLGVPYAAPPTGPLRFMPPGAVRPANQNHQQRRRCHQLVSAANYSAAAAQMPPGSPVPPASRFFGEFGHECVRMVEWRPSQSTPGQGRHEAEDCLNLNIFVPYEPTNAATAMTQTIKQAKRRERRKAWVETIVKTNHHESGQLMVANQSAHSVAADRGRLRPEAEATRLDGRRFNRGAVNSSEANLIGVSDPSQDHEIETLPCYLEPLRVPGAQMGDNSQLHERRWQSFHHYKHQQSTQNSRRRLPVIVLFHSAANDANSLARHLSLAERAQSIVITFNYRIGLLGYLPYIDPEDQTGAGESGGGGGDAGSQHAQMSRLNHALWDQIGLLFWIKQNIATIQGDPNNVTLLSGDNKAAEQIQVLILSPLSKGLFRRVVLTHYDEQSLTPRRDYLGHLFELANRSRELRRKLVSEMGLLVKRLDEEEQQGNATKAESSFTGDRRVFEFLKVANLSQLARLEHGLTKISVSRPGATTIKLNDFISEPNLDDKMLFPYFAQLVKLNQSLTRAAHRDNTVAPGVDTSGSFWSFLKDTIDRTNSNIQPLESIKIETDYCLYLNQLRKGIFGREATDNNMTLDGLNQLDPYKLIPRLSEHQLMALAASASLQHPSHSPTAIDNNNSSQIDSNTMRWTRNRTANAIDFYHLRHAQLLQQLLVRKLESSAVVDNASSPAATLHQNIRRDNPSTEILITQDYQPADANHLDNIESNQDEEDEDNDNLVARQKQQQQLQHEQSSARTKRSALDQLVAMGQQFIELMGNYDLLILVSHKKGNLTQHAVVGGSSGLLETLLRVNNNRQMDHHLLALMHLASLHYISTIKMSPAYLDDLCDISRQDSSNEGDLSAATGDVTRHDTRSSYVVLHDDEPHPASIDQVASMSTLLMAEVLKEFAHSGYLQSNKQQHIFPYDTLNYRLNIGLESESALVNETIESTEIHLELVPYLKRMLASHSKDLHPVDLISCLSELESILIGANGQSSAANRSMVYTRLNEESYCLTNFANKLRNQLRSGAARDLEPITRRYLSLSGEQHQQHRHMLMTKSTLKQQQLALINGLTTRNLVNQSEGLYLDQLAPADQISNDQQMDASTSSNSSRIYPYDLSEASKHGVSVKAANSTAGGSLRGFFAKTYKDAVGQALGIVVGTGALIFLLNLIIVLIIALKSRHRIRNGGQHVHDSSSSVIVDSAGQQQQLKTLNGLMLMANQQVMMNGSLLPPTSCASDDHAKQLTSSFKDQQPRSSLSSNSQRVNKSIKFNLSSVEDQTRTAPSNGGNQQQQHQQRGIMKQSVVTTSDEDDLPPSNQNLMQVPAGTCIHHSHENPYALHGDRILSPLDMLDDSLDLNGFDLNEMLASDEYSASQQQQQQQQQKQQVEQNKYAHHQHQVHSLGSGSLTSPFASQSTPSISAASCGQQIYTINCHNAHHQTSQGHQPGPSHHMIITDNSSAHQHPSQQAFYQVAPPISAATHATTAILNSPSSSNTLSSAPTPILLTGGNEHLSPAGGQHQMVNLIYPCDNLLMQQLHGKANAVTLSQGQNQLLVHLPGQGQQHYLLDNQQQQN